MFIPCSWGCASTRKQMLNLKIMCERKLNQSNRIQENILGPDPLKSTTILHIRARPSETNKCTTLWGPTFRNQQQYYTLGPDLSKSATILHFGRHGRPSFTTVLHFGRHGLPNVHVSAYARKCLHLCTYVCRCELMSSNVRKFVDQFAHACICAQMCAFVYFCAYMRANARKCVHLASHVSKCGQMVASPCIFVHSCANV